MPIHLAQFQPRLDECGKIKIGGVSAKKLKSKKSGREWQPPVKYDSFRVTTLLRDGTGNFELDKSVMTALLALKDTKTEQPINPGGKVRRIPILVHSDHVDEVFPHRLAWYRTHSGGVFCRGDGREAQRAVLDGRGQKTGKWEPHKCPCEALDRKGDDRCKWQGNLYCTIVLPNVGKVGAVHVFRTTSKNSIRRIVGSLRQIKGFIGALAWVPMWLMLKEERMETPEGMQTVYVLHVEAHAQDGDLYALRRRVLADARTRQEIGAVSGGDVKLGLPVPADDRESADEQEGHAAEFHPGSDQPIDAQVVDEDDEALDEVVDETDSEADAERVEVDAEIPDGEPAADPDPIEPEQSALRGSLGKMLNEAVLMREPALEKEPAQVRAKARARLFADLTQKIYELPIPWNQARRSQLEKVFVELQKLVAEAV